MAENKLVSLETVQEKLRERIRSAMMELIPDEAFDELVKKVWQGFAEGTPEVRYPHSSNIKTHAKPPELETLIRNEMRLHIQERIKEWSKEWATSKVCTDITKEVFENCTKIASQTFLHRLSNDIVTQAASAMQSQGVPCNNCGAVTIRGQNCPSCGAWNA